MYPVQVIRPLRVEGDILKYGILLNTTTENIGDDIQSYAAKRFLPQIDYVVDRESLDIFGLREELKEPVSVIMNGWYMYNKYNWPPSPMINPLLISMHISNNDYFGIGDCFLDAYGGDYLRHYAPVGARDEATLQLFRKKNIDAFYSGCLTLTLEQQEACKKTNEVITVDLTDESVHYFKNQYPNEEWVQITHNVDPEIYGRLSIEDRFSEVESLLRRYQTAKCVITSRLHCALPCLALGTPVLLVYKGENLDRMQSFLPLLHSVNTAELDIVPEVFDIQTPPENSDEYLQIRKDLERRCSEFVRDSAKEIIPIRYEEKLENIYIWQKNLLRHAEVTFREKIEELRSWNQTLERAKQWNNKQYENSQIRVNELTAWANQLEQTKQYLLSQIDFKNNRISELEHWTAELEKAKTYGEEQIQGKDARITELENWTTELEKAKAYGDEQIQGKDARIAELENWTAELEKAKTYGEEQIQGKDARIAELENWTTELEKAKAYGEAQIQCKDTRIAELENWTAELEKAKIYHEKRSQDKDRQIDELTERCRKKNATISQQKEEIRELRHALRTEIAKPWHQKLLHGSKESDYGL